MTEVNNETIDPRTGESINDLLDSLETNDNSKDTDVNNVDTVDVETVFENIESDPVNSENDTQNNESDIQDKPEAEKNITSKLTKLEDTDVEESQNLNDQIIDLTTSLTKAIEDNDKDEIDRIKKEISGIQQKIKIRSIESTFRDVFGNVNTRDIIKTQEWSDYMKTTMLNGQAMSEVYSNAALKGDMNTLKKIYEDFSSKFKDVDEAVNSPKKEKPKEAPSSNAAARGNANPTKSKDSTETLEEQFAKEADLRKFGAGAMSNKEFHELQQKLLKSYGT